jgi:Big-like domain-containing protein
MNARGFFEGKHATRTIAALVGLIASFAMFACGGGGFQPHTATAPPKSTTAAPVTAPTVTVAAPVNNSNVDPTVQFVASAASSNGIASMAISVDNHSLFTTAASSVNTLLNLSSGPHSVTVTATDSKGNTGSTPLRVNVWGSNQPTNNQPPSAPSNPTAPPSGHPAFTDLQKAHWTQYSLLPPLYEICGNCSPNGPQLVVNFKQGVSSPSLTGAAMQNYIAGSEAYSDGFWNTRLVGDFSPNPDSGHTLAPSIHHLVYDVYFYMQDPGASQAIEFDINQFVNGKSFIWGHECRLEGGYEWDTWNNPAQNWVPSGVPCKPQANAWNHLVIEVERTSDDHLHFVSITLNGNTAKVDRYDTPTPTNWYGVTINYQQDGDYAQHAYSVWLDKINLEYW